MYLAFLLFFHWKDEMKNLLNQRRPGKMNKSIIEWENWREVCKQLKDLGAVTENDLQSRIDEMETPGQRLLEAIRQWGNSFVEMSLLEK